MPGCPKLTSRFANRGDAVLAEGPRRALLLDRVWGPRAVELKAEQLKIDVFIYPSV